MVIKKKLKIVKNQEEVDKFNEEKKKKKFEANEKIYNELLSLINSNMEFLDQKPRPTADTFDKTLTTRIVQARGSNRLDNKAKNSFIKIINDNIKRGKAILEKKNKAEEKEEEKKEKKKKNLVVNMSNPQQIKVKKVRGRKTAIYTDEQKQKDIQKLGYARGIPGMPFTKDISKIEPINAKDEEKIEAIRYNEMLRKNRENNQQKVKQQLKELRDFFTIDKGIYSKSKTIPFSTYLQDYKDSILRLGGKIPPTLLERINKKLKKK